MWLECSGGNSNWVHQLVASADLDALDAALGELRTAGWPAPGRSGLQHHHRPGGVPPPAPQVGLQLLDLTSWTLANTLTGRMPITTSPDGVPKRTVCASC